MLELHPQPLGMLSHIASFYQIWVVCLATHVVHDANRISHAEPLSGYK